MALSRFPRRNLMAQEKVGCYIPSDERSQHFLVSGTTEDKRQLQMSVLALLIDHLSA